MTQPLNENIRRLRLQRGLSQVDLAKILNVSKQGISNWEKDNVLPSVEMLVKIADWLRVSTDQLLGRESEQQMDVSGLTLSQIAHIRQVVQDLATSNSQNSV